MDSVARILLGLEPGLKIYKFLYILLFDLNTSQVIVHYFFLIYNFIPKSVCK